MNCFTYDRTRPQAIALVQQCMNEVQCHRNQRNDVLREKIRLAVVTKTDKGHYHYRWQIGSVPNDYLPDVCKSTFAIAYGVSESHLDNLIRDIKVLLKQTPKMYLK